MPLSDQLRDAIRKSGLTHYAIEKATKIDASAIDRFMAGKDIYLRSADRLCELLGFELRPKRSSGARPKKSKDSP